jgi:hypothetical protein
LASQARITDTTLPSDIICELDQDGVAKMAEAANVLPPAYRDVLERPRMNLQEVLMRL